MRRFKPDQETMWFWLTVLGLTVILISYFMGWITLDDDVPIRG